MTAKHHGLSPEQVERLNAHGPYVHGVWRNDRVAIGDEERLGGRARLLADTARQCILEHFSRRQLASLSILDVGCYDGWLLCQLEDLPFREMVGVEPRQKNIEKGTVVREALGLKTRARFVRGTVEDLERSVKGRTFDIVLATGLLHHLESIPFGIDRLRAVCGSLLILETICLPRQFETKQVARALELKDIVYRGRAAEFGLTGHRLESSYSDGSAVTMAVVSVPSEATLRMTLESKGFGEVKTVVSPEEFRRRVPPNSRIYQAVCMSARVQSDTPVAADPSGAVAATYEAGQLTTCLPEGWAEALYRRAAGERVVAPRAARGLAAALRYVFGAPATRRQQWRKVEASLKNVHDREIMKNCVFAPLDKLTVEYAKSLIVQGDHASAMTVLKGLVSRLNADWRSVFRAFCLLAWLHRTSGDRAEAERYANLCKTANPMFPSMVLGYDCSALSGRKS
jgi:predicted RNA methylase